MKKILLESELKKIRLMMDYDPQDTLTENEIPKLVSRDGYWEGELDFTNASACGKFKNNKNFPQAGKWVYITTDSHAVGFSDLSITKVEVSSDNKRDPRDPEPASVNLKVMGEDPFDFDQAELTDTAKTILDNLHEKISSVGTEYGSDFSDSYYKFLKSKPIIVRAYSSIDASSNFPDGGSYAGCSQYGKGKGPRKEYNKCLSQARAEKVVEYLKNKDGILSELKYEPIGMGETNKFSKLVWSESNETFPKNAKKSLDKKNPNGFEKTAPDRRFIVAIPEFNYTSPDPEPIVTTSETSDFSKQLGRPWCYKWAEVFGLVGLNDVEGRNGMMVYNNRPSKVNVQTTRSKSMMSQKSVCWDDKEIGCDGKPGNFVWCKNNFPLTWDAGKDLGLGEDIKIPTKKEEGGSRMLFDLTKLKEVFGSDFQDYFMFNPTSNPNAKVTKNGITVIGPEQTIEFGPWKPSNSSFGVDFAITPFKYRISRIGKTGENNEIEVVGLQKFGFGLSSVDKMPTDDVQSTMN